MNNESKNNCKGQVEQYKRDISKYSHFYLLEEYEEALKGDIEGKDTIPLTHYKVHACKMELLDRLVDES